MKNVYNEGIYVLGGSGSKGDPGPPGPKGDKGIKGDSGILPLDLVTLTGIQTLTNKTMTSANNILHATALATTDPLKPVVVNTAVPPSTGYVLTATGSESANWQIAGDVRGPLSVSDNNLAAFDGTTGKLIKDSGILLNNVVTTNQIQTFTNKTITGTTNTVHAAGFKTTVAAGVSLSTTAPTAGQGIVATSGSTATWQNVGNVRTTGMSNPSRSIPMFLVATNRIENSGITTDATTYSFIFPVYSRRWITVGTNIMFAFIGNTSYSGLGVGRVGADATGIRLNAFGYDCLNATTGDDDTALGYSVLPAVTSGSKNTGVGSTIFTNVTTGSNNVGLGDNIATNLVNGEFNILVGSGAGTNLVAGSSNNTIIGSVGLSTDNATIRLSTLGATTNKCFISGIYNKTITNSHTVTINGDGQLGSTLAFFDGEWTSFSYGGTSIEMRYVVSGRNVTVTLRSFTTTTGVSPITYAAIPATYRPAQTVNSIIKGSDNGISKIFDAEVSAVDGVISVYAMDRVPFTGTRGIPVNATFTYTY